MHKYYRKGKQGSLTPDLIGWEDDKPDPGIDSIFELPSKQQHHPQIVINNNRTVRSVSSSKYQLAKKNKLKNKYYLLKKEDKENSKNQLALLQQSYKYHIPINNCKEQPVKTERVQRAKMKTDESCEFVPIKRRRTERLKTQIRIDDQKKIFSRQKLSITKNSKIDISISKQYQKQVQNKYQEKIEKELIVPIQKKKKKQNIWSTMFLMNDLILRNKLIVFENTQKFQINSMNKNKKNVFKQTMKNNKIMQKANKTYEGLFKIKKKQPEKLKLVDKSDYWGAEFTDLKIFDFFKRNY